MNAINKVIDNVIDIGNDVAKIQIYAKNNSHKINSDRVKSLDDIYNQLQTLKYNLIRDSYEKHN